MSRRSIMSNVRRIVQLYFTNELSVNKLSKVTLSSRTAVETVINAIKLNNLTYDYICNISDIELENIIYPEKVIKQNTKPDLDFDALEKELTKPNVTRMLLWREHKAQYPNAYGRSRFFELLDDHLKSKAVTMRIDRKAGEKMYVDWAGDSMHIHNKLNGEVNKVYLFVTCIGCSSYPYVEAFLTKEKINFIQAHINAFSYFDALPLILVPDNDKSAVIKANKYDPVINESYAQMADYYGIGILPARVRTPKDKATVEKAVLDVAEREIMGRLRNEKFFSLKELNSRIIEILDEFSKKPFQKKEGSRLSNFMEIDKPKMRPLPETPFEYADIHYATVNVDYHVEYEKNFYSVPHKYLKQKVKLIISANEIKIHINNELIASHTKLSNSKYQYQTLLDHMPKNHRLFNSFTKEYFINWGSKISNDVKDIMIGLFENKTIEEQAYRGALGIQRLFKEFGKERFKIVCKLIIEKQMTRNYKTIKKMLETTKLIETQENTVQHDNIRGGQYYE